MTTAIDYVDTKNGWVLIENFEGGRYFSHMDTNGWYGVSDTLASAYFFPSKAKAVAAAKSNDLAARSWIAAPAEITTTIRATKGVKIKPKKKGR